MESYQRKETKQYVVVLEFLLSVVTFVLFFLNHELIYRLPLGLICALCAMKTIYNMKAINKK